MRRKFVNKRKSVAAFRRNVSKTKAANVAGVMRGGFRL